MQESEGLDWQENEIGKQRVLEYFVKDWYITCNDRQWSAIALILMAYEKLLDPLQFGMIYRSTQLLDMHKKEMRR
jgi:hypothetical protein